MKPLISPQRINNLKITRQNQNIIAQNQSLYHINIKHNNQ